MGQTIFPFYIKLHIINFLTISLIKLPKNRSTIEFLKFKRSKGLISKNCIKISIN